MTEPIDDDTVRTLLFTAVNPAGTVAVTTLLNGRVFNVELDPCIASMTEQELGEEISLIAAMARQQARAAQHALVARFMGDLGHDRVATRSFLEHDLGLPSPETVIEQRAALFASRYRDDVE